MCRGHVFVVDEWMMNRGDQRLCVQSAHPAWGCCCFLLPCVQLPAGRTVTEAFDYELEDMKRRMGNNN